MERVNEMDLYDSMGGAETIKRIVNSFYPKVQAHPLLAPIFPEDLTPVMEKQYQFLTQFFGGPPLYSEKHGHPAMNAKHLPFPITPSRAEAWLECMEKTLEEVIPSEELRSILLNRLSGPAHFFINTEDE